MAEERVDREEVLNFEQFMYRIETALELYNTTIVVADLCGPHA